MILTEMHSALRIDLQDTAAVVYTDEELTRAINKAVALMGRIIPRLAIAEFTLSRTIDDETLAIASSTATTAYKPVKYDSETITASGTTYVRDTNYSINYMTGVVTEITGMTDGDYNIDYQLDPYILDINTITDGMLNIARVEYPLGDVPQTFPTTNWYGDYLYFTGEDTLSAGQHVRVLYYKRYLTPTEDAAGDYPLHLDEAVLTGACGQAILSKARAYFDEAVAAATSSDTSLTAADGDITDAETALDEVATYLDLAAAYLTTGDNLINAVNAGRDVGSTYASYAAQEAGIANQYIAEATARLNSAQIELSKSERHNAETVNYIAVISAMTEAGQAKLNEFYAMLGARVEMGASTTAPARV